MICDFFEVTMPWNSGRAGASAAAAALVATVRSGSGSGLSAAPHAATSTRPRIRSDVGRVIRLLRWVVLRSLHELGVEPAGGEELFMATLLDDPALVHHD